MRVRVVLFAVFACLQCGGHAFGQATTVVPPAFAGVEGNASYGYTTALTIQQLYGASQLVNIPAGSLISGVQFRLDGGQGTGPNPASTVTNFDLLLGPSNFPVGSLSPNVAANQGAGTVLVRSGALTFPVNSFTGGAGPNPFGPVISFTTPYLYTGGDLLITGSYSNTSVGLIWDANSSTPNVQFRQGNGYNSAIVDLDFPGYAMVARFTFSAVPEPTTLALLGLAVAGGGYGAWTRRRKTQRVARTQRRLASRA